MNMHKEFLQELKDFNDYQMAGMFIQEDFLEMGCDALTVEPPSFIWDMFCKGHPGVAGIAAFCPVTCRCWANDPRPAECPTACLAGNSSVLIDPGVGENATD